MIKAPRQDGGDGPAAKGRNFPLWGLGAVVLAVVIFALMFSSGGKEGKQGYIPPDARSKIDQEKAKAQKEFAEFIRTPAGRLWQKHPYWDAAACQKIAEGQVFTGMSREQAAEAVATIEEIVRPKGEKPVEIWRAEGRGKEKWILRFEENTLVSVEER